MDYTTINTKNTIPAVSKELFEALDELFPLKAPEISWNERQIWTMVGQREVINFLKHKRDLQIEDSLTGNIQPN
jgi:hypothetical protein